jgi:hypothetical protein
MSERSRSDIAIAQAQSQVKRDSSQKRVQTEKKNHQYEQNMAVTPSQPNIVTSPCQEPNYKFKNHFKNNEQVQKPPSEVQVIQ